MAGKKGVGAEPTPIVQAEASLEWGSIVSLGVWAARQPGRNTTEKHWTACAGTCLLHCTPARKAVFVCNSVAWPLGTMRSLLHVPDPISKQRRLLARRGSCARSTILAALGASIKAPAL